MFPQYPHIIKFRLGSSELLPTLDDNGDWIEGDIYSQPEQLYAGRLEPNDKGKHVQSEDGQDLLYGFELYMKRNTPVMPAGTVVKVFEQGTQVALGVIKRFHKGQLNCMAWVDMAGEHIYFPETLANSNFPYTLPFQLT